jgi:hypothetical protein
MPRGPESRKVVRPSFFIRLAAIAFIALVVPVTPTFAQASGFVQLKIIKVGLLVGAGAGSGVLTYGGRNYRFRWSGISLGITAGATAGRLEGSASGIRKISDFAGTYNSVGGGGALVGGVGAVHLRNDKGVTMELRGPRGGLEFAANLSTITISMN